MRRSLCLLLFVFGAGPVHAQNIGGAQSIYAGLSLPAACAVGQVYFITTGSPGLYSCESVNTWTGPLGISGGASVPQGSILFVRTGACPTGFTEVAELDGQTIFGTLAANKDVGTTGGDDTITPAGTNATVSAGTPAGTNSALTFTGAALGTHLHAVGTYDNAAVTAGTPAGTIAWPAGVPTFTGTLSTTVVNHLHTLATGTTATGNFSQVIGTVDTTSGGTGGTPTQTALGTLSGNPTAGGAASYTPAGTIAWPAGVPTFAGSALGTHDHTLSGSSEAVSAGTPTGTINTPTFTGSALGTHGHTFTGTQFDNRSAFTRLIACEKD